MTGKETPKIDLKLKLANCEFHAQVGQIHKTLNVLRTNVHYLLLDTLIHSPHLKTVVEN